MKHLMAMACLALAGAPAHAERIEICYNYGCATRAGITLTEGDLAEVEHLLQRMPDAHSERDAIARAIGLLEEKGWLRFHRVLQPARRTPLLVNEHWAAQIMEKSSEQPFVVDSWFFDNGHPATIFTLDDWLSGADPNG